MWPLSVVGQLDEPLGELARAGKHWEVATGHLVDLKTQALPRDALLEVSRKQPIAPRYQYTRRYGRPGGQRPGLGKHALAGRALEALVVSSDCRIDVVKE